MPSTPHAASPAPTGLSVEAELKYYKTQYEQMEADLQDFQASSRDLEQELERDIEASEKRERQLREKVDKLGYEAEEWKTKHMQAKTESNNAQNTLQKEITKLRDDNRTLLHKLRDIEVANDDFERQARHQTSSLEDLESKYNVGIERGVMLEEEVKLGEQERESLRIETQRLREELSDLKIESDITHEKLRIAEATIEQLHERKPRPLATNGLRPPSPASEASTSATTLSSSPTFTPPPAKSDRSNAQTTPPSPPLSDASTTRARKNMTNPMTPARQRPLEVKGTAPRTTQSTIRPPPRHSRGPSVSTVQSRPPPTTVRRTTRQSSRPSLSADGPPLVRSGSLYQLGGLIGKVQRLQDRVQQVRSKLPAPTVTPPGVSPRGTALGRYDNVTLRSRGKRASNSTASSDRQPVSRLSFGFGASTSTRPEGSAVVSGGGGSRPSSRASITSHASAASGAIGGLFARPPSRSSTSGRRTPSFMERRPRSSMSGSYAGTNSLVGGAEIPQRSGTPGPRLGHGHSHSVSGFGRFEDADFITPLARRTTMEKGLSAIPTPSGIPRRQSGGANIVLDSARKPNNVGLNQSVGPGSARPSSRAADRGDMPPPPPSARKKKLSGVGETF